MTGKVYLVGAGPGDPRLVTARALELLARADVIVYDRLVAPELLREAPSGAELVYVGKRPGNTTTTQEEINLLLVDRARSGNDVVRLKGGDPFVFGRGGEEAEALVAAGVSFEVVPGVTAGIAAPALAGIPVTHRDVASAVAFVTGHEDSAKDESALDWHALASFPGTLVFYMGVRNLPLIAGRLMEHGRPASEPAAVVERGSFPDQRTVSGPLGEIAQRSVAAGIGAPAVTVVGPVAELRSRLAWLEGAPLSGRRVAVTRARAQASGLARRLRELGADPVELPAIRIEPREGTEIDTAIGAIASGSFDVLCLTSANGVAVMFDRLAERGADARSLAGTIVAAIGPGTAAALSERGIAADVVPQRAIAEELAAELTKQDLAGRRVLIARAAEARDVLPDELRSAGADVEVLALYDTVREDLSDGELAALDGVDYVTFTSSSTVRFLLDSLGDSHRIPARARIVSIGPITSAAVREAGLAVDVEASRHDVDGVVEALLADATEQRG